MADKDFLGGVTNTTLHYDTDGTVTVEEKLDVQSILDHNQRGRDHRFSATSPEGNFREVANVDMVTYLNKCREIGQQIFAEPDVAMELILADPAYAKLRSAPSVTDPHIIIRGAR
jgi:hypothetical protein